MTASRSPAHRPLPYRQPEDAPADGAPTGVRRRRFLGWVLAGPTLAVAAPLAASFVDSHSAGAAVPSEPELADITDLGDIQDDAAMPTSHLIKVVVNEDGTASFALPRTEVGQGITTSTTMLIAEELDLPMDRITVTLADGRPELLFNQLTGGSNTTRSTYQAIRGAAAVARARLVDAAAKQWGVSAGSLTTSDGMVRGPGGRSASYGSLTRAAAASTLTLLQATPKTATDFTVIGTPQNRVDALAAVTGRKAYTNDLQVPNALPTMIARPPTINGTPKAVGNLDAVRAIPGITDVAMISTGVAVRGKTFGQCIDAVRALQVTWGAGTEDGKSDDTVLAELRRNELPLLVPKVPLLTKTVEGAFTFYFRSNSPLETGTAIADYRGNEIEVWSCLKAPNVLIGDLAAKYHLPLDRVTAHVMEGGGSFGRHLFSDAALEAVEASKAFGKPVKLMWHRTDDFRQGRVHPMATSRVRATYLAGNVLTYEQRHTSVSTDFGHGLGDLILAMAAKLPGGNYSLAQAVFMLTQTVSYNYGLTTQLLNEVDMGFNTGSMRNIYSPDVCTAQELITDQIARLAHKDPYTFRKAFLRNARGKAVLDAVAQAGQWGRAMPAGTAQGIAMHNEYKGYSACLVEIDCRPATVDRVVVDAYTGPRVTKVVFAVDVGLPINPRGLEAQMQGGIMDGIAQTLTSSLHLQSGTFLEGSWDDYYYTRQWNVPPDVQVIVMPPTTGSPGGAGELAVSASMAATACAYARATGTMPTEFPINHHQPLGFTPLPTVPPIPQSPTDGLANAF